MASSIYFIRARAEYEYVENQDERIIFQMQNILSQIPCNSVTSSMINFLLKLFPTLNYN